MSVVTPARNAVESIVRTGDSVRAQTHGRWEWIVVDDGSADGTHETVAAAAFEDARIRVVRQPPGGRGAACNTGIALSRHDWLLFLGAGDWLSPSHLACLVAASADSSAPDAIYCGWARVAADGTIRREERASRSGELFEILAHRPLFPMHSCLVRRERIESVGGFDPRLFSSEGWDVWQRVARTGAHFLAVPDVLAFSPERGTSSPARSALSLQAGLRVAARGHAPDPRVPEPKAEYRAGCADGDLDSTCLHLACWPAGLLLGSGGDARPLLDGIVPSPPSALDPTAVAAALFDAPLEAAGLAPHDWPRLWPDVRGRLGEFLALLEARSGTPDLARRALRILEGTIVDHSPLRPLTIGETHAVALEATHDMSDLVPPTPVERIRLSVTIEGAHLGALSLSPVDGAVRADVVADAVAARFAWDVLGRLFRRTVYCRVEHLDGDGDRLHHDRHGWELFLQDVWGRPGWSNARFYEPLDEEPGAPRRQAEASRITVELSDELPDVVVTGPTLLATLTVGGVAVGVVPVPCTEGLVRAGALRAALNVAAGFEICRAAVREGVLGRPLDAEPPTLRGRLAESAARRASGRDGAAEVAPEPGGRTLVLTCRVRQPIGSSASRIASLPADLEGELRESAARAEETLIETGSGTGPPGRVIYAPWVIRDGPAEIAPRADTSSSAGLSVAGTPGGRAHFEAIFARQANPWRYTHPYEATKYAETLELLPRGRVARALEIGCAEGHFTVRLAPRVGELVALDISQIALDRAAARCADLRNVRFARLDLQQDRLPGRFDLVVCSELLYYMGDREGLRDVAEKVAAALAPGGHLLMAHAHQRVDDPDEPGFDWGHPYGARVIGETFAAVAGLRLDEEVRTPAYRIQRFERTRRWRRQRVVPEPKVRVRSQPTPLPPHVAGSFREGPGPRPESSPSPVETSQLPILVYHRVSPAGASVQYRVTPESFEEQLRYLRDAGFYGIDLEEWRAAASARRPVPGRALAITFDDGYQDFADHAWPLLRHYGFTATVFLVVGEVGATSGWDAASGQAWPLMDWGTIRRLQSAGVSFGAHSVTHRPLTALPAAEVVREAARSRAVLTERLGAPPRSFAYPFGDCDEAVEHLVGACGYTFGLTCRRRRCRPNDSLMALPRIEIIGGRGLAGFVAALET